MIKLLFVLLSFQVLGFNVEVDDESTFKHGNPFEVCENEFYNNHPLKEKHVDFKQYLLYPSCRPETLYLWAGNKRTKTLKKLFSKNQWPSLLKKQVFTSMWPVKTFYYGQNSIRIKLKKNVVFKNNYYDGCNLKKINTRKRKQLERTVYYSLRKVKQLGMTYEFLICSPKVIESISFGQYKHLQETLKDLKWSTDQSLREYGKDYSYIQGPRGYKGIVYNLKNHPFVRSPFLRQSRTPQIIDKIQVNQSILMNHLNYFKEQVRKENSWIYYNPELNDHRDHFSFENPIYFQNN